MEHQFSSLVATTNCLCLRDMTIKYSLIIGNRRKIVLTICDADSWRIKIFEIDIKSRSKQILHNASGTSHHEVLNPHKPGKLRVAFDCAASYRGISINQALMPGLDLVNNLQVTLLRFHNHSVSLIADIGAMFYHVRRAPRDRGCPDFYGGQVASGPRTL